MVKERELLGDRCLFSVGNSKALQLIGSDVFFIGDRNVGNMFLAILRSVSGQFSVRLVFVAAYLPHLVKFVKKQTKESIKHLESMLVV